MKTAWYNGTDLSLTNYTDIRTPSSTYPYFFGAEKEVCKNLIYLYNLDFSPRHGAEEDYWVNPKTKEKFNFKKGLRIIADAYNSNPNIADEKLDFHKRLCFVRLCQTQI